VERALLHEAVGDTLESLYEGRIASREALAVQLAWHFQEAGIAGKAITYLLQAGERAVQLSAYQEAIAHLSRGLSLLQTLPDSPQRARRELELQLAFSIARSGLGFWSDVGLTYNRARQLAQQTGETPKLSLILGYLSILHYVRAEHHTARKTAEEGLHLAQDAGDRLHEALGHWYLGMVQFALGQYTTALNHLQHMASYYKPDQHPRTFISLRGSDGGSAARAYLACCLWCLGYPDQAAAQSQRALTLARELGHPWSLADVLCYAGCMFHGMRRDPQALLDAATELAQVAEKGVPGWEWASMLYRGEALALLGQLEEGISLMREGVAGCRAISVHLYLSCTHGFLAETQARAGRPKEGLATLEEALTLVAETDEHHWEAELYRLRAQILLLLDDKARAEANLQQALQVARDQNAKSWELRAATDLARLWASQGQHQQARHLLAGVYDWFTEGFDTADLIEARTLIQSFS